MLLNSPRGILSTISVAISLSLEGSAFDLALLGDRAVVSYVFDSKVFSGLEFVLGVSVLVSDLV